MIRRPPRSTLFPTRRSSDLRGRGILRTSRVRSSKKFAGRIVHSPGPVPSDSCPKDRCEADLAGKSVMRSEEHTSELQSRQYLVCRLLLEKKNNIVRMLILCY